MPVNIEIKARCADPDSVRAVLAEMGARRVGLDHQVDTYFNVGDGRLKLRSGNIEKNLIFYRRPDGETPKKSDVYLYPCENPDSLALVLGEALGVRCVVDKRREIYFHDNVKLHVDEVSGLGSFVEIEVIEDSNLVDEDEMRTKCEQWMKRLGIVADDLIEDSYSDMLEDRG